MRRRSGVNDTALMQISLQNLDWLNTRQTLIASNVANASTPGYKARDVRPFADTLEQVGMTASSTHAGHFSDSAALAPGIGDRGETPWATYHSGGNVSLEQEMVKASEVSAAYRLNTSIIRSFHTFFLSTMT